MEAPRPSSFKKKLGTRLKLPMIFGTYLNDDAFDHLR